jgi:anti-sigma B factor antagonist
MPLPPDCLVLEERPGEAAVVQLNLESLTELEVEPLRGRLVELAAGRAGQDLRLDLGRLGYLTSTGLGLFVSLNRRVREAGGRLSLLNVTGAVYEVFAVTRLTTILDVRREGSP